jgi:hypothetical protein
MEHHDFTSKLTNSESPTTPELETLLYTAAFCAIHPACIILGNTGMKATQSRQPVQIFNRGRRSGIPCQLPILHNDVGQMEAKHEADRHRQR